MNMSNDGIRLLVVDDEVKFVEALARHLGLLGFDVTAATSGKDAMKIAEEKRFDLALLDLRMPEMSGEQVLELLKLRDSFIEVIMLTGHGSIDSAIACTRLGAFSYLQKPCETEELLKTLRAAYHQRVSNRLASEEKEMEELARIACEQSPLAALHRLRELERKPR